MRPADAQPEASLVSPAESRLPALLMAVVSLVLSTFSLSFDSRSGASAELLFAYSGQDPAPSPLYPIWSSLLDLAGRVSAGTLAFRAGLLSVMAGGLCVYLLGRILQQVRRDYMAPEDHPQAPLFCAMPGAAYLLLSLPFLMAADRAHPVLVHVAMLLVAIRGIQRFAGGGPVLGVVVAAGVAGMAAPEWWVMAALTPLLLLYGLKAASKRTQDVPAGPILFFVAWLVGLGCTLALIQIRAGIQVPPGTVTPTLGQTLFSLLTAHREVILAESDLVLWSCFLVGALLPWLLVLYCAGQMAIENPAEWAILHTIFTGVAGVFLALGAINVFGGSEPLDSITLLGVVLSAGTFGYSCAFWYALFDGDPGQGRRGVAGGRFALVLIILFLLSIGMFRHYPRTDVQTDYILNQWAKAAIGDLPDQAALVGEGPLFTQLAMAAAEAEQRIHTIDRSRLGERTYLGALQAQLDSTDLGPLLLATPTIVREVLLTLPQTCMRPVAMLDPLPHGACPWIEIRPLSGFHLAGPAVAEPETEAERSRQIWRALADAMDKVWANSDAPVRAALRRQTSRLANDLGLQLYRDGKTDQARATLAVATRLNPASAVPAVNRALISAGLGPVAADDTDWMALQDLLYTPRPRRRPLGGYDRDQGCILNLDRLSIFQQGIPPSLTPFPDNVTIREAIARFLIDDPQALTTARFSARAPAGRPLGGYLIALNGIIAGDSTVLREGMNLMDPKEVHLVPLLQGAARWALDHGNAGLAHSHIQEALALDADDPQTLELATLLDLVSEHPDPTSTCGRRLADQEAGNPYAGLNLAHQYLEQGYLDAALDELAQARRSTGMPVVQLIHADLLLCSSQPSAAVRSARQALARSEVESATYWRRLAQLMTQVQHPVLAAYAQLLANRLDEWNPSPGPDIDELLLDRFQVTRGATFAFTSPSPADPLIEPITHRPPPTNLPAPQPIHVPDPVAPPPTSATPARPAAPMDATRSFDDEDAKVPLPW